MSSRLSDFIRAVPARPWNATPSSTSAGVGACLSSITSACGWPEPRTGIRLPRGQRSQLCSSRVNVLSSRMARSRYFSRISSSVAGIAPTGFTPRPGSPPLCNSLPAAPGDGLGHLAAPRRLAGGRRRRLGLQELQRLDLRVAERGGLGGDVRVAQRLEELLRPVEVAHADPDRAQALGDVRVGSGTADDP